jgi:hypothetical protein
MLGCGHATGPTALARSSYSIGVSMPRDESADGGWEDLQVFEQGVGQLDPGAPSLPVEQFGLHAAPE